MFHVKHSRACGYAAKSHIAVGKWQRQAKVRAKYVCICRFLGESVFHVKHRSGHLHWGTRPDLTCVCSTWNICNLMVDRNVSRGTYPRWLAPRTNPTGYASPMFHVEHLNRQERLSHFISSAQTLQIAVLRPNSYVPRETPVRKESLRACYQNGISVPIQR